MTSADGTGPRVIEVSSLREFFHDSVQTALDEQHVRIDPHTEQYVVDLLTVFARTEALFDRTPEGLRLRPLACMLSDALEADGPGAREHALRRLGDVSLFIAGFLSQGFSRRLVDVDYHIAMGGRAYGALAAGLTAPSRRRALAAIFDELARKFHRLVDVLNDVAEMAVTHSDRDRLRLYEVWLKTGSPRARALLERAGVAPVVVPAGGFRN